jgi:hypothetical protein
VIRWILEAGYFLGGGAILLTVAALFFTAANHYIGQDPDPEPDPPAGRRTPPTPVIYDTPAPPNYTRGDRVHQWDVEVPDAVTAELDLAEALTAKLAKFVEPDPLDDTVELPTITDDTPLYYRLRPPTPLHLESFTQGWTTERLAKVLEAGKPQ